MVHRHWLQCKIGKGTEEHTELVKELCLFMLNMKWDDGKDPMQQMLLWIRFSPDCCMMHYVHNSNTVKPRCRYLYGTVAVTPYEKQVLQELGLEAGEEPDYSSIEAEFEEFDLDRVWQAGWKGHLIKLISRPACFFVYLFNRS